MLKERSNIAYIFRVCALATLATLHIHSCSTKCTLMPVQVRSFNIYIKHQKRWENDLMDWCPSMVRGMQKACFFFFFLHFYHVFPPLKTINLLKKFILMIIKMFFFLLWFALCLYCCYIGYICNIL